MTHNEEIIANEIAELSAKALLHRINDGLVFNWHGTEIKANKRSAAILEKAAKNLAMELARIQERHN